MENNKFIVIDADGKEVEMDILFTFQQDGSAKSYVLYTNPNDEEGQVYASSYDEEGNLNDIENEDEWAMIEEVFNTFIEDKELNNEK